MYTLTKTGLPHRFYDQCAFDLQAVGINNARSLAWIRTSKDSVDPKTIEVNKKNTSFAQDAGACVCYDSRMSNFSAKLDFHLTNWFLHVDDLDAMYVYVILIAGAFKEAWSAADVLTGTDCATILELTYDATKMDVVPDTNGTDQNSASVHPFSTVTMAEAYTDYDLTTDNKQEFSTFSLETLRKAIMYYSNNGKLKKCVKRIYRLKLTRKTPHIVLTIKNIPREVRVGNEYTYYGAMVHVPTAVESDQLVLDGEETSGSHIMMKSYVRYWEHNREFDTARM